LLNREKCVRCLKVNSMKVANTTVLLFILSVCQVSFAQEKRKFTNSSGKEISASIVSASDTDVTLQLENGKTITAGLNFFSKPDQDYVKSWAAKNPAETKYSFDVKTTRNQSGRDKSTRSNTIYLREDWIYKMLLENRSKVGNKGVAVSGATLEYNIFVTPKVETMKSSSDDDITLSGRCRVQKGKITLPDIAYLGKAEFSSVKFPINHSELAPGWYYTDGSKDERKDDLEGIWIQVVKGKEILFEKKIGTKELDSVKWSAP
jgi:hypothetical protein